MVMAPSFCSFLCSTATRDAQAATQTLLNVPYGLGEGEKLDMYLPKQPSNSKNTRDALMMGIGRSEMLMVIIVTEGLKL